jgi:hypothetical protein
VEILKTAKSISPRQCSNCPRKLLCQKLVEGCRFHRGLAISHNGECPLPASVDIGVGKQKVEKILRVDLLAQVLHVPQPEVPRQVRIELACALYARGAMSHAQATQLAGLDRFEMGEELAQRNIPRHYATADLAADIAYGCGQ